MAQACHDVRTHSTAPAVAGSAVPLSGSERQPRNRTFKKRSHRKPSRKKRGAQPGHPKHERPLVPESELERRRWRAGESLECGLGSGLW